MNYQVSKHYALDFMNYFHSTSFHKVTVGIFSLKDDKLKQNSMSVYNICRCTCTYYNVCSKTNTNRLF